MPMPAKLPDVIPISDLEQDAASILQRIRESGSPTIITQEGRAAAILIDFETFRRGESERELLTLLAQGDKEVGEGAGHDLDEVLAEADRLLAERGS
jgi:PHD/YefM family antitoxin component YafN of YafNO toxin-antitoxin module